MNNRQNGPPRELPKHISSGVYRGSGSAAVYRSLEVPLQQPVPFQATKQHVEKGHPSLVGPITKGHGEAMWHAPGVKLVEQKEVRPHPIPLIVANSSHTILKIQGDPVSSVVNEVAGLFERHHVDFEYLEADFSWTCMAYANHVETKFICHLFSVPDLEHKNFFVLDFQRLSGDCQHFSSLHRAMNIELVKNGYSVACPDSSLLRNEKPVIRSFKPMALPKDFFSDEDVEEEKDGKEYEPLCAMCTSQYIDVQREGLKTLSSQLDQSAFSRKSLTGFAPKLFELLALTRDNQVRRLSATALACLTRDACADSKFEVKRENIEMLVKILLNQEDLPETRRQCARVLAQLSQVPSMASQVKTATSSVKKLSTKDARLGEIISRLN